MTHNELVHHLAHSYDTHEWLIYTEPGIAADCIPDVVMMRKSYARRETRIYEVKVSDHDLTQDVRKMKFQKYFDYADRVFFALGANVNKEKAKEILSVHQVGIISINKSGAWSTNRSAPRLHHEKKIDWPFFLALMMGSKEISSRSTRLTRLEREKEHLLTLDIEKFYGGKSKELDRKLEEVKKIQSESQRTVERMRQDLFNELREKFGLSRSWYSKNTSAELIGEIVNRTVATKAHEGVRLLEDEIKKALNLLEEKNETERT